ncbi:MAG: hypothetical protein KDA61_12350, partial [Planctomycetales bacterium]|nr:hypothetical protein [Planctomycetales bacterium]
RDKTHYYLEEQLQSNPPEMTRLWQFAYLFGEQLRRVRNEDAASLAATGHSFNLHAIIGGRLSDDERPRLIYVYPEGNWVSATEDAPYFLIGRTYYGKPILDRLLHARTPLRTAITLAVLAFDATRTSITDVGCPVDLLVLPNGTSVPAIVRLDEAELAETTNWWEHHLRESLAEIPVAWMDKLLSQEP